MKKIFAWIVIGFLSLSGCKLTPKNKTSNDGHPLAHQIPKNLLSIPDAIPVYTPLSKRGNAKTYTVFKRHYHVLPSSKNFIEKGYASWYGTKFHGRQTSSGEPYDMFAMTAAHKSLPIPCFAKITNLENNQTVLVKINDRGPFHANRIIDLSYSAAARLGILKNGLGYVELKVINPSDIKIAKTLKAIDQQNHAGLGTRYYQDQMQKNAQTVLSRTLFENNGTFYVQWGAFSSKVKANELALKLKPWIKREVIIKYNKKENLHKVRAGPFKNRLQALSYVENLGGHKAPVPILVLEP